MITLLIVRGLPGTGKTTFAKTFSEYVYAADDYFTVNGQYKWDPTRLKEAHEDCFSRVKETLESLQGRGMGLAQREKTVCVTNVFARHDQVQQYADLARYLGVRLWVLDLFDQGMSDEALAKSNSHGVPVEKIAQFRAVWEH